MTLLARLIFAAALLVATAPMALAAAHGENPAQALESVEHEAVEESIEEGIAPGTGEGADAAHADDHGAGAGHGEDTGHGEKAGLPQFDPTFFAGQIFWLTIAFITLYLVFSRKSLPEISNVLESRHQHIQSDLDNAESLRREAEEVHQAYEKALNKARTEATDLYLGVERDMKEKNSAATQSYYERSMREVGATEKRIEQAKSAAMEDMNAIAADIARQVAEKVIGVSTDLNEAKTVVQSLHKRKAA